MRFVPQIEVCCSEQLERTSETDQKDASVIAGSHAVFV